jgi:predicted RNA-binding Zn ribbon-like protein
MDVAELERQVEHKFAPVPLLAVQALANTYSYDDGEELLLDPATAKEWLVGSGLARPGVVVGAEELAALRELRTAVRGLIAANLPETAAREDADPERAAAQLARHTAPLRVGAGGTLEIDLEPVGSVAELADQIAGIVFRSQLSGEWARLKVCACDDCRWSFYDASRNRGGMWCQMDVCGNRIKNRRYRARAGSNAGG